MGRTYSIDEADKTVTFRTRGQYIPKFSPPPPPPPRLRTN